MKKKPNSKGRHFQVKISLKESPMPIWRRLVIDSNLTLDLVHEVFQIAMGWWDYHVYEFRQSGRQYGDLDDADGDPKVLDSGRFALCDLIDKPGDEFVYAYDFGDDWHHKVVMEGRVSLTEDDDADLAKCLHGRRACPPEDCFGVSGYAQLLEAIEDPLHPERQEKLDWLGCDFNPDAFDARAVNLRLALWEREIEAEAYVLSELIKQGALKLEDEPKPTKKRKSNLVVLKPEGAKK